MSHHSWNIRPTTLADLPSMRRMQAASWRAIYPNAKHGVDDAWVRQRTASWLTPEGLAASREHFGPIFTSANHLHIAAESRGEIIGFLHCSRQNGGQHIEALYIAAAYYGSGLAADLMDRAGAWLDHSRSTDLQVAVYNGRAIRFYEKYGYRVVPGSEALFKEKIPVVTMTTERQEEAAL